MMRANFDNFTECAKFLSWIMNGEWSGLFVCAATHSAGSMLLISLGPRDKIVPLNRLDERKSFRGEWELFIQFAGWSISDVGGFIAGSDDMRQGIEGGIDRLSGEMITELTICPGGALKCITKGGLMLEINDVDSKDGTLWTIFRPKSRWSISLIEKNRFQLWLE